jgi:hypothetical protein
MQRHLWLPAVFALALALAGAGVASAKIYHWVDAAGTPHFSDRAEEVPPAYRDQIRDFEVELERSSPVNIIEGLNQRSQPGVPPQEEVEFGYPPAAIPEMEELPGFAADPTEMLQRMAGPMMAVMVVLMLVFLGFAFAFLAMALLVGCRLVGQESPGFKKAYGIVIVQCLAALVAGSGVVAISAVPSSANLQAINMGVSLLVHAAVLRGMLCDTMGKSIALAIVVNLVLLALAFLLGLGVVMCAGGAALLGGA